MGYFVALAIAIGLGLPIAVIGAGLGQGKAVASAMEGIARQPEAAGKIQTAMIIGLALIESLVIYALVIAFLLLGKLPETAEIMKLISK
jgi:F-type H+-transporting ATPase subunit c